jgi:hypothetical protein
MFLIHNVGLRPPLACKPATLPRVGFSRLVGQSSVFAPGAAQANIAAVDAATRSRLACRMEV